MNRFVICLVFVSVLSACTDKKSNPICAIDTVVASSVSVALATPLQCSNPAAIQADVRALLDKVDGNLCEMKASGLLGPVCGLLADQVIDLVVGKTIPAAWGCKATGAKDAVKSIVVAACDKVI